ncbi:4Fe-4S ferredoxin iron-sulfur binding domain-containing protein [Candidatus Magnetoovum chiemensis]|nr:4Fe-4S ferredoxin iron-sulfur binding domain-containing protein [Candidatus Magnetoovum chiemensis]
MKRQIIHIDQDKCTGCEMCVPGCPEGAIQIIDGKARLISDLFCDGLGACLGHCPEGAITIEEREAQPYSERLVMGNIVKQGANVIKAHLEHLKGHNQTEYLNEAIAFLEEKGLPIPINHEPHQTHSHGQSMCGCPSSNAMSFAAPEGQDSGTRASKLTHWPIQLHLISPNAPYFQGTDLLMAADCTAFALGDFHKDYLKGKTLVIACPKLDTGIDVYIEKITALIDQAKINTLTVMIMQVPCCRGLLQIAQKALETASRKVPVKCIVVGIKGEILSQEWI